MDRIDVTSMEIRDYALSMGWSLVREALKDGLFVLNSPHSDYTQLIFPKDQQEPNYNQMAGTSLERLAEIHGTSLHKLIEAIREVNDDVICLRYYSENKVVNSISFEEALESISATRQLLLSAASSVVNPSTYHPKLNRTEPQELIKRVRFRHTEEGSFVLKISCPFENDEPNELNLLPMEVEKPFGRSAFELINRSSTQIIEAVESATIDQLFEIESNAKRPTISYNFCDALARLYDEERELPFQLIFNWSMASKLKMEWPGLPRQINFPFSHKDKIAEVKSYFAPRKRDISETLFVATVETLDGEIGPDNRRSGAVGLLLFHEGEVIKARVNLKSDHYSIAMKAHPKGGTYVQLKGDLKRGKMRDSIENVVEFKLLEDH